SLLMLCCQLSPPARDGAAGGRFTETKARLTELRGRKTDAVRSTSAWRETSPGPTRASSSNAGNAAAVTASGLVKVASDGHVAAQSPAGFQAMHCCGRAPRSDLLMSRNSAELVGQAANGLWAVFRSCHIARP